MFDGLIYDTEFRELTITNDYNCEINSDIFPNNCKILNINKNSITLKKKILPKTIEEIYFSPTNYSVLHTGCFPSSLKILVFGEYTQIQSSLIPNNLKILSLSKNKKYEISGYTLPKKLEYLILNSYRLVPLSKRCDENYTEESIELYKQKINNLIYLSLDGTKKQHYLLNNLPQKLEIIKFSKLKINIHKLPSNIKKIILDDYAKINLIKNIPVDCHIIIDNKCNIRVGNHIID